MAQNAGEKYSAALACRKETPVFIDHVSDQVRSRTLSVLSFSALFMVTCLLVFSTFYRDPRPLLGRPATSAFNTIVVPSKADATTKAIPSKFRLINFQGFGVQRTRVVAQIAGFQVSFGKESYTATSCNPYTPSLAMSPFRYLCYALVNNITTTDDFGIADFASLRFAEDVIPGTYNVTFVESTAGFVNSFYISVPSMISSLAVVSPALSTLRAYGVAINATLPAIRVRVKTLSPATPLKGITVRIVPYGYGGADMLPPWVLDPLVTRPSFLFDLSSDKFFLADGTIAITDADGIATFNTTRLLGTNSPTLYLAAMCEGAVAVLFDSFAYPPIVTSPVAGLSLFRPPPSQAQEAQRLAFQPAVLVTDANGAPLPGRVVFASIGTVNGARSPEFFVYEPEGAALKIVTGAISLPSNASGVAVFEDLRFSSTGPAGLYTLKFACDGVRVAFDAQTVNVTTSVASVSIGWANANVQIPGSVTNSPLVLIRDSAGQPLEGKAADIVVGVEYCGLVHSRPSLANGVSFFDVLVFLSMDMSAAPSPYWTVLEVRARVDGVLSANAVSVNFSIIPAVLQFAVPTCIDVDESALPPIIYGGTNISVPVTFVGANLANVGVDLTFLFLTRVYASEAVAGENFLRAVQPFLSAEAFNPIANPFDGDYAYYRSAFNVTVPRTMPFTHTFSVSGYSSSIDLAFLLGDVLVSSLLPPRPFVNRVSTAATTVRVLAPASPGFVSTYVVQVVDVSGAPVPSVRVDIYSLYFTSFDAIMQQIFGLFSPSDMLAGTRSQTTNATGHAVFADLRIGDGYPGTHGLFFLTGDLLLPQLLSTTKPRVIARIEVLQAPLFFEAEVGSAALNLPTQMVNVSRYFAEFTVQPIVRLVQANGQPVVGTRCVIAAWTADPTTWRFSEIRSFTSEFIGNLYAAPGSEASVGSFYSLPSDSNGIAVFQHMGIWFAKGSQFGVRNVSVVFFSDTDAGAVFSNASAVVQVSDRASVIIVEQPSGYAAVGVPFRTPVSVSIANSRGEVAPISHATVTLGKVPEGAAATLSSEVWPFRAASVFVFSGVYFTRATPGTYTLMVQFPDADPVETQPITVVDKPFSVSVVSGPPLQLRIGEIFSITAVARIQSGSVLPGATLQARLVGARASDPTPGGFGGSLASALTDVAVATSAAFLDPFRTVNVTDKDGAAQFWLTVSSAPSGYYSVVVTSGGAIALPSTVFYLENPVKLITILTQPAARYRPLLSARTNKHGDTRTVVLSDTGDRGVSTMVQPRVQIFGRASDTNATLVPLAGVVITAVVPPRSTVTNGTVSISVSDLLSPATLGWSGPLVTDANGIAQFTDLHFLSGTSGVYTILFRANGVDSSFSGEFLLTNQKIPDSSAAGQYRLYIFIVLLILLPVLFGNQTFNSRHSMVFALCVAVSILIVSFLILATSVDSLVGGDPFQVTLSVMTVIVLASLWLFLLVLYVTSFFRLTSSAEVREARAFQSVTRLLSRRTMEQYWEDHYRKRKASYGYRAREAIYGRSPARCRAMGCWRSCCDVSQIEEKLTGFEPWEQWGDFAYPQRLLITFVVSMVVLVVAMLGAILAILWLQYSISLAYNNLVGLRVALERQQALLSGDTAQAVSSLAPDVVSQTATSGVQSVNVLAAAFPPKTIVAMLKAVGSAGGIALVAAVILVLVLWWQMFVRYRQNICRMRAGKMTKVLYKYTKYDPTDASAYLGTQTVHTFAGFALAFVFLWITLFLLFFRPTREYLFRTLWPIVLGLLTLNLAMQIAKYIASLIVVGSEDEGFFVLPHPRWWATFELVFTILNIINGITLTVARITASLASTFFLSLRTDFPLASKTREHADPGFRAYVAMLLLDYHNNHPIAIVFSQMLLHSLQLVRLRKGTETTNWPLRCDDPTSIVDAALIARTRTQNVNRMRWALAVTLAMNPSLLQYRAHALEAVAEAARQQGRQVAAQPGFIPPHGQQPPPKRLDGDDGSGASTKPGVEMTSLNAV